MGCVVGCMVVVNHQPPTDPVGDPNARLIRDQFLSSK